MASYHLAPTQPTRHEFSPFLNLFNDTFAELQRLSDNFPATTQSSFAPKFDVKETNEAYHLEGELPGIEHKNLSIEFSDDEQTLLIKGRTEHSREEGTRPNAAGGAGAIEDAASSTSTTNAPEATQDAASAASDSNGTLGLTNQNSSMTAKENNGRRQQTYWVSERSVGSFQRSFAFPNRVNAEHVKASLKNGILSVIVPKVTKPATPVSRKITVDAE
jgi:HSP20 family protein